jgi:hypothetical protein
MKKIKEIQAKIKELETQKETASFNEYNRISSDIEMLEWVLDKDV